MINKMDFKWLIYPSPQGLKSGLKEVKLDINTRLPVKYRGNPDYKLNLCEGCQKYTKKDLEISKTMAKVKYSGDKYKNIPTHYFENSVMWLFIVSRKRMNDDKENLLPVIFWSLLISIFLFIGITTSQDQMVDAVNLLIKENASKITVFLSVCGFSIFSLIYIFIPTQYDGFEKAAEYICEQFFGLIIGAAAFCIASFLILCVNRELSPEVFISFFSALLICFLVHFIRCFYKELNQFIDNKGRFVFFIVFLITIALIYLYFAYT
jgi:hypothetical protein